MTSEFVCRRSTIGKDLPGRVRSIEFHPAETPSPLWSQTAGRPIEIASAIVYLRAQGRCVNDHDIAWLSRTAR